MHGSLPHGETRRLGSASMQPHLILASKHCARKLDQPLFTRFGLLVLPVGLHQQALMDEEVDEIADLVLDGSACMIVYRCLCGSACSCTQHAISCKHACHLTVRSRIMTWAHGLNKALHFFWSSS